MLLKSFGPNSSGFLVCQSYPVCLSFFLCLYVSVCVCLCLSVFVCVCLCLSVCWCVDMSVCLPVNLTVCLSVWLFHQLYVCQIVCLKAWQRERGVVGEGLPGRGEEEEFLIVLGLHEKTIVPILEIFLCLQSRHNKPVRCDRSLRKKRFSEF